MASTFSNKKANIDDFRRAASKQNFVNPWQKSRARSSARRREEAIRSIGERPVVEQERAAAARKLARALITDDEING